jgi:hypothetical protein
LALRRTAVAAADDTEVGVPELALDNDEWQALMRRLDRVRVTELCGANRRRTPALSAVPRVACEPKMTPSADRRSRRGSHTTARRPASDAGPTSTALTETTPSTEYEQITGAETPLALAQLLVGLGPCFSGAGFAWGVGGLAAVCESRRRLHAAAA